MPGLRALTMLVLARARRRPGRWLLTALGLALATAFAATVAAESRIAGDQAAHSVLAGLSPLQRTVRVSWQGTVTPAVDREARALIRSFGLGPPTEVVLLSAVRLDGIVVRAAAVDPLSAWIGSANPRAHRPPEAPGACARTCPMLLAGRTIGPRLLSAAGVRIPIVGAATLRSAAPLGFVPAQPPGLPVLLTSDVGGLGALAGLSGVYRTHSWLALLPTGQLHSWQLAQTVRRLQRAQAELLSSGVGFSLSAPFAGLQAARSAADAAPNRLLLAGGGALAALALFIVLAAGGLRRDVDEELGRLSAAGATTRQRVTFVVIETSLLCGAAIAVGAALALALAAVLADDGGVPVGGALTHSLLTPTGALALVIGWLCATALVSALLLVRDRRLGELPAVAALAGLVLALSRGTSGNDPLPVLLAPLCCLAAGVIVARVAVLVLRGGERLARHAPVSTRLAFVGLARAPGGPSLAIAFIAVSVGLGGFALAYRATLLRSAADQAANLVPLDATVAAGVDFTTPLQVAPRARWAALAGGSVEPVRRTEASFLSGENSVTVPALGVPAETIPRLHGWRPGDSSGPLSELAARLGEDPAARASMPVLATGVRTITLPARSSGLGVTVTADFLDPADNLQQVELGQTGPRQRTLAARMPPTLRTAGVGGSWRLAGLELDEPAGLEITNGHQNAENPAAATQFTGTVMMGGLTEMGTGGRALSRLGLGSWRAIGAAHAQRADADSITVRFSASGQPGLLRPLAPGDQRPVPVLVDPQTAAAAGPGHRIALEVDGLPVGAEIVGVVRRFPTIPAGAPGFIVFDQQSLASALDAQQPGQGRADELWISSSRPRTLQDVLAKAPFAQFSASFRGELAQRLRDAPVSRAVLGTLLAAAGLAAALALVGLLVALLGSARDVRFERDLIAQGVGPAALRTELRLRLVLAATLGVIAGLAIGILLTRLAVATVQAAGAVAIPNPPVVSVAPWGAQLLWGLAALAILAGASWLAARRLAGGTSP